MRSGQLRSLRNILNFYLDLAMALASLQRFSVPDMSSFDDYDVLLLFRYR